MVNKSIHNKIFLLNNGKNKLKVLVIFCFLVAVMLSFLCVSVGKVYCQDNEKVEFTYNGRVFGYELIDNIKSSPQFDLNYEINKYNRFSSGEDRKKLFKHMLDVGFDKSVALNYIYPNLDAVIEKLEKNIQVKPRNASLKINENTNKVFIIQNEVVGIELDRVELYSRISNRFLNGEDLKIEVPIKKLLPSVIGADLKKFTNLRADFSTDISNSSADRKHNIKNALNSLNRVEIAPNQVFSFNKTVGRRTKSNGYRTAKIIVNNEFVDGIGGGVCQVSTTLYNSALLSGLEIIEANKHSKQISYVKYGFDAMVNFGSSDLKFRNNTNEKITIITNYSSKSARIRIFGESLGGVNYKLTNEIVSITEPKVEIKYDNAQEYLDKVEYDDEYFYLRRGGRGMEVKSYREKYDGGKLVSRELLRDDKFKVQNAIKVYGTKKRTDNSALLGDLLDLNENVA